MEEFGRLAVTLRAGIDYANAVGLVKSAEGHLGRGCSRVHSAHEKANLVRSTLPDVLSAEVAMRRMLGENEQPDTV